jgi:DNA-binding response OmpR family regulator
MWLGTWGGAVRYDGYSLKIFRANENDTTALLNNRIYAFAMDTQQNIWVETGADAYVTKPFSTNVLRSQVQNLLEQRQRLRELFSKGTTSELKKIAVNTASRPS